MGGGKGECIWMDYLPVEERFEKYCGTDESSTGYQAGEHKDAEY